MLYNIHDLCWDKELLELMDVPASLLPEVKPSSYIYGHTDYELLGCDVHRPKCIETTALGAAYLAGLAVGYWKSLEDIRSNWAIDRVFASQMEQQEREKRLKGWHKAVKCAIMWGEEE